MSSYASDKLYNEYLRRNMGKYLTRVKVREILPHLPCLTQTDKEEIEAKREIIGNYNAMQLLFDCLKRRDNWAEEFIAALEICDQKALADEIRAKYDSYMGPPVTRTHVSPPPSANPSLPIPESVDDAQAAQPPTAQAAAPPAEAPQATPSPPPVRPVASPSPAPQVTTATEPVQASQIPATFDIASQQLSLPTAAASRELSSDEIVIHNIASAPDIQVPGVGSEIASVPEPLVLHAGTRAPAHDDQLQTAHVEISLSKTAAPVQNDPSSTTETPPAPAAAETTPALDTTESPPAAAAEATPALDTTEPPPALADSTLVLTPEKHPVQDTAPPEVTPLTQQPEENSYPISQVTENDELVEYYEGDPGQQTAQTTVTHLPPPVDSVDVAQSTLSDEEADGYFSKPGVLVSPAEEPFSGNVTLEQTSPRNVSPEPFSGNVSLQISDPAPAVEAAPLTPVACAAVAPEPLTSADSPSPCQENGVAEEPLSLSNNEPEENLFESTCQSSLGDQEVLTNVVHVSGEPSVQNHDGQTPSMLLANAVSELEDPPVENIDSQSQITLGGAGAVSVSDDLTGSSTLGGAVSVSDDITGNSLGNEANLSGSSLGNEANLSGSSLGNEANLSGSSLANEANLSGSSLGNEANLSGNPLGNEACFSQDAQSHILNGQATKEPASAPATGCGVVISVTGASSNENSQNFDLAEDEAARDLKPQGQEDPSKKGTLPPKNPKNYLLLTAAAVGVSALFVAWRLKN